MCLEYVCTVIHAPELVSQRDARGNMLDANDQFVRGAIRGGATFVTLSFFPEFPPSILGYREYNAVFTFGGPACT